MVRSSGTLDPRWLRTLLIHFLERFSFNSGTSPELVNTHCELLFGAHVYCSEMRIRDVWPGP